MYQGPGRRYKAGRSRRVLRRLPLHWAYLKVQAQARQQRGRGRPSSKMRLGIALGYLAVHAGIKTRFTTAADQRTSGDQSGHVRPIVSHVG